MIGRTWSDVIVNIYDNRSFNQISLITIIVMFFRRMCCKVRNFPNYFEIEFLSYPKMNGKTVFPHIYFLTSDYKSCLAVCIIKWMINYYFCQSLKKSEISIYQPVTPLLQMKLFLQNNITFSKKCTVEKLISHTIFFFQLCDWVQKQSFGGDPESTECVKVPIPAHQVLPLAAYIFEASYSM